tara:strand:- start:100 stop:267 length:168 start_codon:yes stop_codon:yes gene_type:complete
MYATDMAVLVLKIKIKNLRIGCIKSASDITYPDNDAVTPVRGYASNEFLKYDIIF